MKLSTLIFIGASALLVPILGTAQTNEVAFGYYNDALDYSQNELIGSARMLGMGGAKASLGADLSSAVVNPAGLGFYNKTVLSISPTLYNQQSQAGYLGSQARDFTNPFGLATFGVVFNSEMEGPTGDWRGGNLAITHTRLNTYSNNITYEGSLTGLDQYTDLVGYAIDELNLFGTDGASDLAFSAFETFLVVGPEDGFSEYTSLVNIPSEQQPTFQREVIEIEGRKNTFNIAYGANYRDKLYVGVGVGFLSTERTRQRTFTETPFANDTLPLIEARVDETLNQSGNGFSANLGVIYRPVSFLTLGASFETGTFFSLSETFEQFVTATWRPSYAIADAAGQTLESGVVFDDPFEFTLVTPPRIRGGATVFLGKSGFISADVEYIDYSRATLRATSFSLSGDNQAIENLYTAALNYSVGGEFRQDNLYARAGYALRADPLANPIAEVNRDVHSFTAGAGLRKERFFIDLAFVHSRTQSEWNRYFGGPFATVQNNENRVAATFGVNF